MSAPQGTVKSVLISNFTPTRQEFVLTPRDALVQMEKVADNIQDFPLLIMVDFLDKARVGRGAQTNTV